MAEVHGRGYIRVHVVCVRARVLCVCVCAYCVCLSGIHTEFFAAGNFVESQKTVYLLNMVKS